MRRRTSGTARGGARSWRAGVLLALAAVAPYLAGAVVSAHLSPLDRRPLLDGLAPAQPYKWVSPPPGVKNSGAPGPARHSLNLATAGGVGFVTTTDGQAQLIIGKGTWNVPGARGQRSVLMTVVPSSPAKYGKAPPGLTISGNVYLITTTFQPSRARIESFSAPVTLILRYPAIATAGLTPPPRTILWSGDGRSWTKLSTQTAHVQQSAYATIHKPGYYAVSVSPSAAKGAASKSGRVVAIIVAVALAVFVLAAASYVIGAVRRSRA